MSWIGGLNDSFNQITSKAGQIGGQLSTFTKEVLSESTDEVIDYEAEVKRLRFKLIEAEAAAGEYETQVAEQKQRIQLLEDQCRKSNLEAHSCARQYEAKFQKQSKLIDQLKQEQSIGTEEEFQIISKRDSDFSKRTFSGGSQDAAEYADIIHCQREINRLSEEVEKIQDDRDKWKSLAQFSQDSSSQGDISSHSKIKELEERLHETLNRHQHEYLALQGSNAASTRRLQDENRKLRLQMSGQAEGVEGGGPHSTDDVHSYKQQLVKLTNENQELNEKLRTRSRQLQVQKKSIDDLRVELEECEVAGKNLTLELQKSAVRCEEIDNEKRMLQAESKNKTKDLRQFIEGIANYIPKHAEDVRKSGSYESVMNHVRGLRESHDYYHNELMKVREKTDRAQKEENDKLAKSEQQSHVESSENPFGQSSDIEYHQVGDNAEDELQPHWPVHLTQPLYQSSPQLHPQPHQVASDENFLIISPELAGRDIPEADLTLTLQALQKQVEDYEVEIAQYELVQKEWQDEKQSLQVMLERYQIEHSGDTGTPDKISTEPDDRAFIVSQLKKEINELQSVRVSMEKDKMKLIQEKEQLQNAAFNLQEELNMSISEAQAEKESFIALKGDLENALHEKKTLEAILKTITDELNSSRMEKEELDQAIEALDAQHQDEMAQVLKIRADLSQQNKTHEENLKMIQDQNKNLEFKNQQLMEKTRSEETCDSELSRIHDDLAALVDEKQLLEQEVETLQGKLSDSERKLLDSEDAMLNAETDLEELKGKLATLEQDKFDVESRLAATELENQASIAKLQEEIKNYIKQLDVSENRLDAVESQKKKMEEEQKMTTLKMNQLTTEHQNVIAQIDAFQENRRKSEETYLSSIKNKDEQLKILQSQLNSLEEQNQQRLKELTKHNDSEVASSTEVISLKNEIFQLNERLQASILERDSLQNKIQVAEDTSKQLQSDLQMKAAEITSLMKQLDLVKNEVIVKIQEITKEHNLKYVELTEQHKAEVLKIETTHQTEIETLKEGFALKMEQVLAEHEDNLKFLLEEQESLKHQKSMLEERMEFMEQDVGNEVKILQEKLDKSEVDHSKDSQELTLINARLNKELCRERTLVESLEEELKKQLEICQGQSKQNEQEINQLHSTVLNEKSILQTSFDEEKRHLKEKYDEELAEMKRTFNEQAKKSEGIHAEEILKTVSELKDSHRTKCKNLEERLLQAQQERATVEEDLRKAQGDLVTLSDHYEQEEAKLKNDASSAIEKLEQSHSDEILKLKSENEDLLQRMTNQNMNSIGHELAESQLTDLQDVETKLLAEVDALKIAGKEQQRIHREELAKNMKEILSLKEQLSELQEKKQNLQSEKNVLQEEHGKLSNMSENASNSTYEDTIASLKSELANLKLLSVKVVPGRTESSSSGQQEDIRQMLEEVRMRDLGELEKADLSKEDISTLLSLIKERDHVINVLSAEVRSKESTNDHEVQLKRLNEEKEQILNVISEKTKENRNLKDDLHRMMDVIAAGKSALSKVQEENQALVAKYEGLDQGMTKETVTQLSKLVSEKDLEIEALKQKCQTLLDVLHQQEQRQASSPGNGNSTDPTNISAEQLQGLLKDRETLSHQIRQLLTERDHLVGLVNNKHQEAVFFQEEARKASESLERDAAENSRLQVSYNNLVHDYEQLEIRQTSVQKQLSGFKETMNHLEESKEILLAKLDIESPSAFSAKPSNRSIDEVMENLRSDTSKSSSGKSKQELQSIVEKNSEALLQKDLLLQENMDKSSMREKEVKQLKIDLREKDILIHKKMEEKNQLGSDLAQRTNEVTILRKSVENLREQISNTSRDADALRKRLETVERTSSDKESESQAFQETNAQLSVMLKEREYELETLKEKIEHLNNLLQQNEQGKDHESQKYLKELDRAKEQTTSAKHERDQIMLTLKQKQIETQRATEEARQLRDKESKLQSELTRLRGHLVQVEETYTQEAVLSAEREQALRSRLEQIQNKNASAVEANELSKQQMESLQEQIRSASQQRDQAIQNLQLAKEQNTQYASALHQLQMAAERMQREEAATYNARVEKINQQYQAKVNEGEKLVNEVLDLKAKLEDAGVALESASRLNEQLELKEQTIDKLKQLVSEKQLQLEDLQDELHKLNAKSDAMVDRQLVKNLLIGYFSTPPAKQPDVVRLISSMIGFTKEEEAKLQPSKKGWVSGWLPWGRSAPTSPGPNDGQHHTSTNDDNLNESFTGMFVKFLEEESAKRPLVKLPAAAMVNSAQKRMNQRKLAAEGIPTPAFNPPRTENSGASPPARSTVAGRYNPFLPTSSSSRAAPSGPASHPLMQPLGSMLPTFSPLTSFKPSSERDLLQGILQAEPGSAPT